MAKQYLPLLREGRKGSWAGSGSVSSWDEPLGFLERKREVLLDKRSYSESDLSKIAVQEVRIHNVCTQLHKISECKTNWVSEAVLTLLNSVLKDQELSPYCTSALGNEKHWCVQDLIRPDLRPVSPTLAPLSPGHPTANKESRTLITNIPIPGMRTSNNCAKRSKCTAIKALHKYSSNMEVTVILTVKTADDVKALVWMHFKHSDLCLKLCRNPHNPGPTSVARAVAKAMADQGPPGETVLQRSALLQVKKKLVRTRAATNDYLYYILIR